MMKPFGDKGFNFQVNSGPQIMRAARQIIHFVLVLTILSTGLPVYQPGDANRDDRVDLADAILRVQGVARTAEQPAAFRDRLEEALITLSVVAGFKKVVKADRGQANQQNTSYVNILAINAACEPDTLPLAGMQAESAAHLYRSPALAPPTPPPLSA
ncbi:MAG: hypothetical protein NTV82_00215 [Candidatus Aminicenantes bacterium]|nr:hypothetical protein [Candidatus Aminicenantes bacterium]